MRYVKGTLTKAAADLLYLALTALDTSADLDGVSASDAKAPSQKAVRDFLAAVADGAAGADRVGATPIAETGAAATVQAILEALVTRIKAVTDSASGGDLVGLTAIAGWAGTTVQAVLEAAKVYVDGLIAAANALVFVDGIDCSANPNYPAADCGDLYVVSVAGIIGGASGVAVEVGDFAICRVDSTASGDQAAVGANWSIINKNVVAASATVAGIVELLTDAEAVLGSDTERAMTAANLKYLIDNRFPGLTRHLRGEMVDPDAVYAIDGEHCLIPKTDAALTFTAYDVTCDANPTTEFDCDLYWADDFVTRANATKLADITTTDGKVSATGQTLSVAAGKAVYLVLADPDDDIKSVTWDFHYDYDAPA